MSCTTSTRPLAKRNGKFSNACALRKYGEKLGERLARLKETVDMLRAQEGGAA